MPLLLPPTPADMAALPYFEFHPLGLERRRADLIRRISGQAAAIEALTDLPADIASGRLQSIPGIGPWTAAEAKRIAFGDPDAVSVGDAHLPDLVAWSLAGEARADDARMLELLEPYRGQRARVVRLLEVAGIKIPRFGPRFAPRHIRSI
jgi:3-methyladenine DNA glycosylase/8-oxoguanine DNA glycosylase